MTTPQDIPKNQQQTARIRRVSLAEQQVMAAQQASGLSVIRSLPLDFGDR